jgi:hypothetical protein
MMLIFLYFLSLLPGWPAGPPPHASAQPGGINVVEQYNFAAKQLFFSEDADTWGASNDWETMVVRSGHVSHLFPVGARDFLPRLSVQRGRVDLCEIYWMLEEAQRSITPRYWDGTGRAWYFSAAYPQDDSVSIGFVRYLFSRGLEKRDEPILPADLVVLDASGRLLHKLLPNFQHAERLSLAVGGDHIAAADYRQLYIWNWRTGALLHGVILAEKERFPLLAMTADGKQLAVADGQGGLRILKGKAWTSHAVAQPGAAHLQLCFSPDGKFLYGVDGKTGLLAWQLGEDAAPAVLHAGAFTALAVSRDGRDFLVGDDKVVYRLHKP